MASLVVQISLHKGGEVAKADHRAHLIGWSVYDFRAQLLAILLEETQLTGGKWKKK